MDHIYFTLQINPEPWAVGEASIGRKAGALTARISPNPNLAAYQNAVREELEGVEMLPETFRKLTFYFWRQQARYLDAADRVRQRNQADATNLQKGLEDALQGVLFENDREIKDIRSVIVDQGPHVKQPGIIIRADRIYKDDFTRHVTQEIPPTYLDHLRTQRVEKVSDKWSTSEDVF